MKQHEKLLGESLHGFSPVAIETMINAERTSDSKHHAFEFTLLFHLLIKSLPKESTCSFSL